MVDPLILPYLEGVEARYDNETYTTNPYPLNWEAYTQWGCGWRAADRKLREHENVVSLADYRKRKKGI